MNTSQLLHIFLCAACIALVYLVFYLMIMRFACAELSKSGASRGKDAIQIYAGADSLEYYLRIALAASAAERITIIVNIPKNDSRKNEMKDIVRMMRRRHKNIFYRIT